MKFKKILGLVGVFLFLGGVFSPVAAATPIDNLAVYGGNHHVQLDVHEDGKVDVTVTMDVTFNQRRQGIFVEIPREYRGRNFTALGGDEDKDLTYYFPISNFKSSTHEYVEDSSSLKGNVYRLGTKGVYLQGSNTFQYSYTIQTRDLRLSSKEQFFFINLIGGSDLGWEFPFKSVSFEINFDKPVGNIPIEIQGGKNNTVVPFELKGNKLTGTYDKMLLPGEAITIAADVANDYFVFPRENFTFVSPIVGGLVLAAVIVLFMIHGRDYPLIETVEFTAPDGLNSAEVSYIIKGYVSPNDVTSLIIYWASKGLLSIDELEDDVIQLNKLKDITDGSVEEVRLFEALFKNRDEVTTKQLENKFHTSISYAANNMPKRFRKDKELTVFDSTSTTIKYLLAGLIAILPAIFAGLSIYNLVLSPGYAFLAFAIMYVVALVFSILGAYLLGQFRRYKVSSRFGISVVVLIGIGVIAVALLVFAILCRTSILLAIVTAVLYGAAILVNGQMGRRTKQGMRWYGQVLGLKRFIETAEVDRLEALVEETPFIFYDILPFAYVLGVSTIWSKKFETLAVGQPDWYHGSDPSRMTTFYIWHSLNRSLNTVQSSMVSVPKSSGSSSGGFGGFSGGGGGGGFSGGGFGGGGGGSW